MRSRPSNALYAQSGGPTAVINATAAGLILAARAARGRMGKVYAARDGILGVLTEDFIDTSRESIRAIADLANHPGAAFGTCRYRLADPTTDRRQYDRMLEVFRAHDIGYFFYNGGNDSQDTAWKVSRLARESGWPLVCIGIPKTVDNDLPLTDCCPGFGSAAKFLATTISEAALDVASMARTSTRVFIMEVMGRNAGWLAASAGLAAQSDGAAPHVILFPEIAFRLQPFLARVKRVVETCGYCVIAASEGLQDARGKVLAESGKRDAFGHPQLGGVAPFLAERIQKHLRVKVHWAVPDYLQRSARHLASAVDLEQAYRLGEAAVAHALRGGDAAMMTVERLSSRPYRWRPGSVPLARVANRENKLPRRFISRDGWHITDACRQHLLPLIEGEALPPFERGLPRPVVLKSVPVLRRLPSDFRP